MTLNDFISKPDPQIDLAAAALCLALDEYPRLDVGHYMDCLAAHADAVRQLLDAIDSSSEPQPGAILDALAQHLFESEGFSGNATDYYDPRNSFLNEVLDRRIGIPLTLSIVYMEVGQRLGLSISPISFPTHFLVRVRIGELDIVVDPFNKGRVLSNDTLIQQLIPLLGDRERAEDFLPAALANVPRREVIARMLRNLKAIYVSGKDWSRALRISNHLLDVDPQQSNELRDRAHLYAALECPQAALEDYGRYLRQQPDAQDAAQIEARMIALRRQAARIN